jgi:phosphoacetylglucosamine mutase
MILYGTSGFRMDSSIMISYIPLISIGIKFLFEEMEKDNKNEDNIILGLCFTASHNPPNDNGIKIVDRNGMMLEEKYERLLERVINGDTLEKKICSGKKRKILLIAKDTRTSGIYLKEILTKNLKNIKCFDIGTMTTPQFHNTVLYFSRMVNLGFSLEESIDFSKKYYTDMINNLIRDLKIDISDIIVDCSNGVGYIVMKNIAHKYPEIIHNLMNTSIGEHNKLNVCCGSDFLMTKKKMNYNPPNGKLNASLDGDADRMILWGIDENNKFLLIDGDYQMAFIFKLIIKFLENEKDNIITVGVIHTDYANGGLIDMVDNTETSNNIIVTRKSVPVGIKNLIQEAKKYDISVYFEQNGHGSVIINNDYGIKKIKIMSRIFSKIIGDGIHNLLGIVYLLKESGYHWTNIYNLFNRRESILKKIDWIEATTFTTDGQMVRLVDPFKIDKNIMDLLNSYEFLGCRVFLRPSGTEPCLRLYAENDSHNSKNLEDLVTRIENILST